MTSASTSINNPNELKSIEFQLFSDIHTEFSNNLKKFTDIIKPKCDILILAGDIGSIESPIFELFLEYCSKRWKYIIYVLGNHEYYSRSIPISVLKSKYIKLVNNYSNIYLLDNKSIKIGNYSFYGSTLWSSPNNTSLRLNDYKYIRCIDGLEIKCITNKELSNWHKKSVDFLLNKLSPNNNNIIITHFPPTKNISNPKYKNEPVSIKTYFENDILDKFQNKNIICWLYGHTHYNVDKIVNNIRIISNQVGYSTEITGYSKDGRIKIEYC